MLPCWLSPIRPPANPLSPTLTVPVAKTEYVSPLLDPIRPPARQPTPPVTFAEDDEYAGPLVDSGTVPIRPPTALDPVVSVPGPVTAPETREVTNTPAPCIAPIIPPTLEFGPALTLPETNTS